MKSLRTSIYALGVSALSLLPLKSDAGTLSGKVTDMFSNSPYNDINVTLVNESGDVYETTTGLPPTAVEPSSWGLIKRGFIRSPKLHTLEEALGGTYAIDVPDGVYTLAFTDGEVSAAKPTTQDLFNLKVDLDKRTIPRAERVRVNGSTVYNETLLPKDFDLEYAWTVLSGKVVRYDYDDITFYVDVGPARNKHRPDPKGKIPQQFEIDNVVNSINEFVRIDTDGKKTPKIEIGTNAPEYISNPKGGMMVPKGYALFFWDSGLPLGAIGSGSPWIDESGKAISSLARYGPGFTNKHTALNEVLGAGGLWNEPTTDLDARIRSTGSSVFLDGGTDEITERDAQIIKYHGVRPIGTTPNDVSDLIVNE
ncbi:hypothetical protein HYT57_02695 [Candidatus Woesearchaeota archaeon]|nr:hypothetical protein [Candidatus Woesearchaeota archaeon]